MTKKEAIAEVFVTAFKSLPENEKGRIVEELLSELDKNYTKDEWRKIEKLANQKGKMFFAAKEAKCYLNKI